MPLPIPFYSRVMFGFFDYQVWAGNYKFQITNSKQISNSKIQKTKGYRAAFLNEIASIKIKLIYYCHAHSRVPWRAGDINEHRVAPRSHTKK